jgi:serine/threonine-protein kinase
MSDIVTRLTQALSDRYRIEQELGAGGMATVWRAIDLKHDRDVAIKVLHPDLGAALGAERFLTEIKTTARLQHPHILPLLDSGAADGLLYYVMPMVQGETLRARLNRERPLPIAEALRIAREVGSALDYAHRQGIVHRDVKPENILLHDGQALVADFGIALAVQTAGGQRMTQTGLSLGTPQYMSPEQAMGERAIDARSDVYALGAVTYEMLTGEAPFSGSSVQAIVAKVMTERPTSLHTLRDTVPPHVEQAVMAALAKLPADRFASAQAFVQALGEATSLSGATTAETQIINSGGYRSATPPSVPKTRRAPLIAAVALNAILAGALVAVWTTPAPEPETTRQQVVFWSHQLPNPLEAGARVVGTQVAIAPDGSSVVYSDSVDGEWLLFRKTRGEAMPQPLAGTEGAISPTFSPDGQWVAYVTRDGRLRKLPVVGGTSVTVTPDTKTEAKSIGWLDDGTILFTTIGRQIHRVPATGGASTRLNMPLALRLNLVTIAGLPGSRGFLFTACSGNCAFSTDLWVYDFAADSARLVQGQAAGVWFAGKGPALFTNREGGLLALPFDPETLTPTGEPVPIIDGVEPTTVALSASGTLLYGLDPAARGESELFWVTRDGQATSVDTTWRGRFEYPAISPDGKSIAVSVREGTTDLWIRREDGSRQKIVTPSVANWRPAWSPDGTTLGFLSVQQRGADNTAVALQVPATGGMPSPLLSHGAPVWEVEFTRSGEWMAFRTDEVEGGPNIRVRRMTGDTVTLPFLVDTTSQVQIALSPDDRWLAYTSSETGRQEVWVSSFPDPKVRRLVSRDGGTEPRWSRSGRELFYEAGGNLVAVRVPQGPSFDPSPPRVLFPLIGYRRARNRQQYDVAPDDARFLMISEPKAPPVPTLIYAEHWLPELQRRMRAQGIGPTTK